MHRDLLCLPSHLLLCTTFLKTFPFRDLCPRNRRYIQTASTTGTRGRLTSSIFLNRAESPLYQAETLCFGHCLASSTLITHLHLECIMLAQQRGTVSKVSSGRSDKEYTGIWETSQHISAVWRTKQLEHFSAERCAVGTCLYTTSNTPGHTAQPEG